MHSSSSLSARYRWEYQPGNELFVAFGQSAQFNYSILARVATQGPGVGEVALCIIAEGRANAAVEGGLVLYSSAATTAPGWDGHINRIPFVNGNTNFTSVVPGGYCNPDRTVRAECEACADVG
ncbi:MAG: hypothetical protein V3S07_04640 [Micropepsaceae bacterium]